MEKLITESLVCFGIQAESKEDVIRILAEKMQEEGRLNNIEGYIKDVMKREESFSTGVGFSVATPHAKSDSVNTATIAFARLNKEIDWDKEEKASIIFQLAIPVKDRGDRHLQILAALSRKLVHEEFRNQIEIARRPREILELIGDI